MTKSRDAFRTISEVAEWLDTPAHVLRFWESKFSQVKPVKRAGGRRYYRPEDMALLGGIKTLLHDQGMTIKGAQKLLREKGVKWVATLGPAAIGEEDAELVEAVAEEVVPPADNVVPIGANQAAKATAQGPSPEPAPPVEAKPEPDAAAGEAEPASPETEAAETAPAEDAIAKEDTTDTEMLAGGEDDTAEEHQEVASPEAGADSGASINVQDAAAGGHTSAEDQVEAPETEVPDAPATATDWTAPLPLAATLEGAPPASEAEEAPELPFDLPPDHSGDPQSSDNTDPAVAEPVSDGPAEPDAAAPESPTETIEPEPVPIGADAANAPEPPSEAASSADVWDNLPELTAAAASAEGHAPPHILNELAKLPPGALAARSTQINPLVARLEQIASSARDA